MAESELSFKGLSDEEVGLSRQKHGSNQLDFKKENNLVDALRKLSREPMVILLLLTSAIYFFTGNPGDGIFLAASIVLVSAISLYQDSRSRVALEKLKSLSQPFSKVIRNSKIIEINSDELVVGDKLIVEEGIAIAADGVIIQSNDFSVDESILTGESLPVYKDPLKSDNLIFRGTTVSSGLAVATVTLIGNNTRFGKISRRIESIAEEKSPLEKQIGNFVKKMVVTGIVIFLLVWMINFLRSEQILDSLLKALTLAMSILPEEIPVAFTTFMALGTWRLMKIGVIVKQMKTVETLGSATVICIDKTGTITENRMQLAKLFTFSTGKISDPSEMSAEQAELIRIAMWASEPLPFDPMEKVLHRAYSENFECDERVSYRIVHEYPLNGKPPMMTHVFQNKEGKRIIAAKGAPEALIAVSDLTVDEKDSITNAVLKMASEGYRLLGVGESDFRGDNFPANQQDFRFQFKGIVAFYDPPKKNIIQVLENFYKAGITVKIVTGDNAVTTASIAKQIRFKDFEKSISGEELTKLDENEAREKVKETRIFTRMFPEAKLKIINALKESGEIVAMTGDGVNDAPALRAAHIGIAMGKKGTEIAKQAASLVLSDDDLSRMVDAVAMGRKIYSNLKKAIQYIISIHIPIILTVFIPLALAWIYPNIFSPVHVIFLELIMGPTCSIIYENEPIEPDTMLRKPRPFTTTFFNWKELGTSIIQGLAITAGTLFMYHYSVDMGLNEKSTRTMVFTTLIAANIFLTLENRSFFYSAISTLKYKNNLVLLMIGITILLLGIMLFVGPVTRFFEFESISFSQLLTCIATGFVSVFWFEIVKWIRRWNRG
jgi:P-type Ca2+ transporter type 2C